LPFVANYRAQNTTDRDEILVEDGFFTFKAPQPEFGDYVKAGQWVIDVDIKDRSNRSREFPNSSSLNHLLCCSPSTTRTRRARGYWVRYARNRLAFRVGYRTGFAGGCLLKAADAFEAVFEDKGFTAVVSEKHQYAEGLSALLGSPGEIKLLEKASVRELLWHMQSGKAYPYKGLASILKAGHDCEYFVSKLVQRGILLRGISFRCEACHLLQWHPLGQIGEVIECAGCLRRVQPPVRAPISFKLNELATRAVEQGVIPVLLTQRLLSTHNTKHTLALLGVEVTKNDRRVDVDFATTYHEYLVLAECKEFRSGANPQQIKEASRQLSGLVRVAIDVGAPIVLLSTLLPQAPPELAQEVLRLNRSRRVAVHLVSLVEMELVNLRKPEETVDLAKVNLFYPPEM
jgi:hypothetical protein